MIISTAATRLGVAWGLALHTDLLSRGNLYDAQFLTLTGNLRRCFQRRICPTGLTGEKKKPLRYSHSLQRWIQGGNALTCAGGGLKQ